MSETTGPEVNPDPTPVTEPLQLADQRPLEPGTPTVVEKRNHTRTILEVVGGVVAAGLIVVAAAAGFGLGRLTSGDHHGFDRGMHVAGGQGFDPQGKTRGQDGQGQPGQGMPGQPGQGMPGQRGQGELCFVLPDGQDLGLPGQQGRGHTCIAIPALPGQGMDPRGIDPDGDDWDGGGMMGGQQGTAPATPTPSG